VTGVRRRGLLTSLGTAAVALAGCGYRAGAGDPLWSEHHARGSFAGAGDALVHAEPPFRSGFGGEETTFTTVDGRTGDVRRSIDHDAPVVDVTGGDRCHYVSETAVGAIDPDGSERWSRNAPDAPLAVGSGDGVVAVLRDDGAVFAYDGADGTPMWDGTTNVVPDRDVSDPSRAVAVDDGGAVVTYGSTEDSVAALDSDGDVTWQHSGVGLSRYGIAPRLVDGAAVVPLQSELVGFDRVTGTRAVQLDVPPEASPAVAGDAVYVPERRSLVCYDLEDVSLQWELSRRPNGRSISFEHDVVADAEGVYALGEEGIHAIAPDGTHRWFTRDVGSELVLLPTVVVVASSGEHTAYKRQDYSVG